MKKKDSAPECFVICMECKEVISSREVELVLLAASPPFDVAGKLCKKCYKRRKSGK